MLECCKLSYSSLAVSKGSDCCLTRSSIRAAVQESIDNKEAKTSRVSESKDQASSNRPAQLALFTGVYISLVGVALLVFPASLFGETPTIS